jgi:hypothetical protein
VANGLRLARGDPTCEGEPEPPAALAAFGIGLVHGVGGSAGAAILLVGAVPGRAASAVALVLLALGMALSMALLSSVLGHALGRAPLVQDLRRAVPTAGVAGVLFGSWYALAALGTLPYAF